MLCRDGRSVNNVSEIVGAIRARMAWPRPSRSDREPRHEQTRVGGGYPSYGVLVDAEPAMFATLSSITDLWTPDRWGYGGCLRNPWHQAFEGPFGDFSDPPACESQFRNALPQAARGRGRCILADRDRAPRLTPDLGESPSHGGAGGNARRHGRVMVDGRCRTTRRGSRPGIVDLGNLVTAKDGPGLTSGVRSLSG